MLTKIQLKSLEEYIDFHLHPPTLQANHDTDFEAKESLEMIHMENFIKEKRKPTLQELLFQFIDNIGESDADVYKRAGIDRRHFSKIRSNPEYKPSKNTVISLVLSLKLRLKDAEELLSSAGYTLSESETFDLIIQYCIENEIYSITDVNQALAYFSLKPLGGVLI
ncbi:hypothetical protein [Bacillus sp. FJAT-45066]|uniref:hypothetical protein n=1 Tax=Bacillus sp. FJAT-45066 TaxID=2011010 RepID=UPI000BB7BBC6|nr:hypothetical protein [Bacillus sp. FJAT-45066]